MKPSISLVSSLTFCLVGSSLQLSPVSAQVTADGTTSTTVEVDGNNFEIENGDRVGDNLFHSFDEFSVPTMGSAAFNNTSDIANIFSRVTGSNISNIDGLISANGAANLFLINPNGIIFGENARLNLGGSFFASTADSLLFDGGLEFSASNPTATPLLEVNIPIGLGFRDNPGDIVNRSQGVDNNGNTVGLQMQLGKNITFAGGNITFDGGIITAPGGIVELGGLAAAQTVGLNNDGSLSFPDDIERADLQLTNDASVNVRAGGGGFITVNARNLELSEGSNLLAGIKLGMGSPNAEGGDITINSTGSVSLTNGSSLSIRVRGQGNGGNVIINAKDEVLFDGVNSDGFSSAAFSTIREQGEGNAGNIEITAGSIILTNGAQLNTSTFGEGDAGGVTINTRSLSLTNGGVVVANTFGQGNAGTVTINVTDTITIDGEDSQGFPSGVGSGVSSGAEGDAGDVTIDTGSLSLTNGGLVSASTFAQGNGGSVEITATGTITIDGERSDGIPSGVGSQVSSGAGDAGGVTINTGSLSLTNGGLVSASTFAQGNAGLIEIIATDTITIDGETSGGFFVSEVSSAVASEEAEGNAGGVTIDTGSLSLTNGGLVDASTFGRGNAGSVQITARDTIIIDGENSQGFVSDARSVVNPGAEGDAGGVTIDTGSLSLTNGGRVIASTFDRGDAGSVQITASDTIIIDGENSQGFVSDASSVVNPGAEGDAGGVNIDTGSLSLTNGGRIIADTFSQGNAGSLEINATDIISIDGENSQGFVSSAGSQVASKEAEGNAGGVNISTGSLSLTNGGIVAANTFSRGNAGLVEITANDTITIDGKNSQGFFSGANSLVNFGAEGDAGGVTISTGSLSLTNGGQVSASTFSQGNAGRIIIDAADTVSLDNGSDIQSRVGAEATGNGGNINIQARTLSLENGSEILAETFGEGKAGSIQVDVSDSVILSGFAPFPVLEDGSTGGFSSGLITGTEEDAQGQGGNISVNTNRLQISDGAVLSARSTSDFRGGNIEVNANVLEVTSGGQLITTAFSQGNAGNINLNISDRILFSGSDPTFLDRFNQVAEVFGEPEAVARIDPVSPFSGIFANTNSGSTGQSGNVNVQTGKLSLDDEARLAVNSQGEGNGGSISVSTENLTLSNAAEISAATVSGEGGNINITIAEDIFFKNNSSISARAFNNANGGNVTINADHGSIVAFPNQNNDIIANAQQGNGGNINITTQAIFGLEERPSTPANQTNDIDASSQFGLQGDFSLNTPENEPSRGLVDLPENVVNPEDLISQNACKQGGKSKFTLTGRGGLPATPEQLHSSEEVEVGLVEPAMGVAAVSKESPVSEDSTKIEPAEGWIRNEQGEVILVGYDPTVSNTTPQSESLDLCQPQGDN